MYITLQLFTNTFTCHTNKFTNTYTFHTNKFTSIKVIKNACVQTQSYKNAKLIKAWIKLKLFIDPGLMK